MEGASGASRRLVLVFTLGVPGLGKSSLVNKLRDVARENSDVSMEVCVSDEVRSTYLANEYIRRNLNLSEVSQEDIFRIEVECGPKVKEELNKQIKLKLEKLWESEKKICMFILDKNHCSSVLLSYVREEAERIFEGYPVTGRIMVPDAFSADEVSSFSPFKFQTLAIGLIRSVNRQGHLTMKYGQVHSLLSFITCLQSHLSDDFAAKFPEDFYKRVKVDYYNAGKVENFARESTDDSNYQRLYQLILSLANKTSTVKESAEAIVASLKQIAEINEFIEFNDSYGHRVIHELLN